jgi:hypothetical protein
MTRSGSSPSQDLGIVMAPKTALIAVDRVPCTATERIERAVAEIDRWKAQGIDVRTLVDDPFPPQLRIADRQPKTGARLVTRP